MRDAGQTAIEGRDIWPEQHHWLILVEAAFIAEFNAPTLAPLDVVLMTLIKGPDRPMDPNGPTGKLCVWVEEMALDKVPEEVRTRAKYLILDGIACGLVGAHLPWNEKAANAIFEMESAGHCHVIGWNRSISPVQAALLNSTFIQGFELDDWHSEAPMHSNSVVLPALFSASEHLSMLDSSFRVSGSSFLTATIVGYEVGPRVGNGLYGGDMLTRGWHSGAVFGPAAASSAASKLMDLSAARIEDALGIACTQACGLMSAQFESEVKRMQHGFAARNGLFGALLARRGYIGIKKVMEREYGGFLPVFGQGSGKTPPFREKAVTEELGETWKIEGICVKPYASMAATHPTVDCVRYLQSKHAKELKDLSSIKSIVINMGAVAFHHGGFAPVRPVTTTGAQMSARYIAAVQLLEGEVLPAQFRHTHLNSDERWTLINKITCELDPKPEGPLAQKMVLTLQDGRTLTAAVASARGVQPPLSNDEILQKWRSLAGQATEDTERIEEIERIVLDLDSLADISTLISLLRPVTKNPIA